MTVERPFTFVGHHHAHAPGEPCDCPPDWPRDLSPGDCVACYDTIGPHGKPQGISRPVEQCLEHRGGRIA